MLVFDGNARTVTEVVAGNPPKTRYDVRRDLWSGFQDYFDENPWSSIAIFASGGAERGRDEQGNIIYQSVDFTWNYQEGWRLLLADFPHEAEFIGNLFSNDDSGLLFDFSNQSQPGAYPRLSGAADLLTIETSVETNQVAEYSHPIGWESVEAELIDLDLVAQLDDLGFVAEISEDDLVAELQGDFVALIDETTYAARVC